MSVGETHLDVLFWVFLPCTRVPTVVCVLVSEREH